MTDRPLILPEVSNPQLQFSHWRGEVLDAVHGLRWEDFATVVPLENNPCLVHGGAYSLNMKIRQAERNIRIMIRSGSDGSKHLAPVSLSAISLEHYFPACRRALQKVF